MTDTDTLRKLAEAATPGPWVCTRSIPQEGFECFWIKAQPHPAMRGFSREIGAVNGPINGENEATADFIAAAREAVPALLDEIDRLQKQQAVWKGIHEGAVAAMGAEITALRAKVKAQAEALKPFAELAQHFTNAPDDGWIWRGEEPLEITVGDLRRAAQEAGNE